MRVERIALGPALLGEPVALTLAASGTLGGGKAAADIDLHRIDGATGEARFHLALAGAPLRLELAAEIAEPSGRLLAGVLGRPPLPLTVHLAGDGPLADWHGQLRTTAGDVATLDADFRIQGDGGRYRVATQGTALVAALLPPKLQPLLAGETRFATTASFDDNAMVLDALDLSAAPGTLSASGQWQRDSDAISGQATLDLPALAAFAPLLGNDIAGSG